MFAPDAGLSLLTRAAKAVMYTGGKFLAALGSRCRPASRGHASGELRQKGPWSTDRPVYAVSGGCSGNQCRCLKSPLSSSHSVFSRQRIKSTPLAMKPTCCACRPFRDSTRSSQKYLPNYCITSRHGALFSSLQPFVTSFEHVILQLSASILCLQQNGQRYAHSSEFAVMACMLTASVGYNSRLQTEAKEVQYTK